MAGQVSKAYQKRDFLVFRLGLGKRYLDYLQSDLWRSIRSRVLKRDRNKCRCCGERATEVHHERYSKSVLLGENIAPLLSLCRKCHGGVEFDSSGRKRHIADVELSVSILMDRNGVLEKPRRPKLEKAKRHAKKVVTAEKRRAKQLMQMRQDRAFHERMCRR